MNDENAKIRLRIEAVEVEYEGRAAFLKDDLANLMQNLMGFYQEHKAAIPTEPAAELTSGNTGSGAIGRLTLTTSTIAARLGGNTGPELAMAAAVHLAVAKKQDKFTRAELNAAMKAATAYYKANMTSNLSASLSTLIKKNRLNEVATGIFALSANEKASAEAKLAQSA
ncbi:MAG TPA: hypothetical protein VGR70_12965 [Stellaceae bacterium]|nr:hypothetical protein [Stellaceae bacterium]